MWRFQQMEAISARSVVILMHSQTLHSPTGMESGHFISGIRDIYGMESGHLRGGCWPLLLCGLVCFLLVWVSCLSPACFWSRQTLSLSVRTGCVWEPGAACKELLVCIRTTILSCGHCEKSLYLLAAAPCKVLPSLASPRCVGPDQNLVHYHFTSPKSHDYNYYLA